MPLPQATESNIAEIAMKGTADAMPFDYFVKL